MRDEPCHVQLATGERIQARSVVSRPVRDIAAWVSSDSTSSKARRSIIGRLRSKPTFAPVRTSRSSGAATRAGQATVFLASRARK